MKSADQLSFEKNGFIHLKNLIPEKYIEYLSAKVEDELLENNDEYGAQLNRLKYDLLSNDDTVLEMLATDKLNKTIGQLTGRNLYFIQGIGFEIRKLQDKGFPWHIGKGSYHYQFLEDYACTLWIPLVPINIQKQHGGMAYMSRAIMSGEFSYQLFQGAYDYLSAEADLEQAKKKYYAMNKLEWLTDFLEHYKTEDDFELGDALLFDKYVLHRTNMLYEGPIEKRSAFVMRFIDINSRYDEKRVQNYQAINQVAGITSNSKMYEKLKLENNDLIIKSDYLKPNFSSRIISSDGAI